MTKFLQEVRTTNEIAISLSLLGKSVRVVCDDTDVFVLLVHFYNSKCKGSNAAPMIMSSPFNQSINLENFYSAA